MPGDRANARANLDNPEYATTVCGALQFYEPALRPGMDPLLPRQRAALRAWVERVLCGYWTHAGYLNWDTGASFRRWHQATKFGLAQAALLGDRHRAVAPAGAGARPLGQVPVRPRARAVRPLVAAAGASCRRPVLFGVTRTPGGLSEARLSAARMQANAARAAELGLGALPSELPPPLYAYDPDVGRLAVTTPAYSTAVTVVDYERLPYGGAELARLFDGEMRVAAGIGGRPPPRSASWRGRSGPAAGSRASADGRARACGARRCGCSRRRAAPWRGRRPTRGARTPARSGRSRRSRSRATRR